MSSIFTALGLHAASAGDRIPNHAAGFIIAHYVLAYHVLGTRLTKRMHGIDHNVAPREDLTKYGEPAVQAGKISRQTLDQIKRTEAAQQNAIEHLPLFIAGVLLATHAGVPNETINRIGVWYTLSRVAYGVLYIVTETETLSWVRSAAWLSASASCITALVLAGKRL